MYGLLIEGLAEYIKDEYGEDKWDQIRKAAGVDQTTFSTHQIYPENMIPKIVRKSIEILVISEQKLMCSTGQHFVGFVGQYGYDQVLSVLGRNLRDFLNGLDNLHEYLKFSYPRMRAPSFFCENETSEGLTLHYRSKRKGFVYYTMGQIKQVAKHFYNTEIDIELVKEELLLDTHIVTFSLRFDNRAYNEVVSLARQEFHLPIKASLLMEIFPFSITFGSDMVIRCIGNSLKQIMPHLEGLKITDNFDMTRPLIEFQYVSILKRTNNIFELKSTGPLNGSPQEEIKEDDEDFKGSPQIVLKGQMLYMAEWKMIMFLGTPVMPNLDAMVSTGLYINDLSMHDFSRDLMMAGTQQSVELKLALDQEQQKSKKLEDSMRKLDEEMKRTDELLYQMIPKLVADRLRKGDNSIDTCQVFDLVTVLFSDIVSFTVICSKLNPMQVVSMLNSMYSSFDQLTEINGVYKVETIGDAYMIVGGAPEKDPLHACKISDMALDMLDAIKDLTDPSTGEHLRIRVGVHSGTVVAGVVGLKMPRYCLFGDTVNTASRMESTSQPMRIQITESTQKILGPEYQTEERGTVSVKGKGEMKTFWLNGKQGRPSRKFLSRSESAVSDKSKTRGYSPVTLEEVAKRTPSASPMHASLPKPTVQDIEKKLAAKAPLIAQEQPNVPLLTLNARKISITSQTSANGCKHHRKTRLQPAIHLCPHSLKHPLINNFMDKMALAKEEEETKSEDPGVNVNGASKQQEKRKIVARVLGSGDFCCPSNFGSNPSAKSVTCTLL